MVSAAGDDGPCDLEKAIIAHRPYSPGAFGMLT